MQSREKGLAEITKAEYQAAIEANERYLKSYGRCLIRSVPVSTCVPGVTDK